VADFRQAAHRILGLILLILVMVSCGPASEVTSEAGLKPTGTGVDPDVEDPKIETPEVPADPVAVNVEWATSAHADTYVLSVEDRNSTCAACHAPVQWIPSIEDMPESCTSCKFEVDPPPPVIAEADWTHVECRVCHAEKKGEIQPEVLWLEIAPIEEYAQVSSHSQLCLNCHLAGEVAEHVDVQVQGDHQGYGCTECHQAHSLEASCGDAGCHRDVLEPDSGIPGHDEDHALVGCEACHDAGGQRVGPHPEVDIWTTFVPSVLEEDEWRPFVSHDIQLEVSCERCHYEGNPWELASEPKPTTETD
jgi:hypothetical protein